MVIGIETNAMAKAPPYDQDFTNNIHCLRRCQRCGFGNDLREFAIMPSFYVFGASYLHCDMVATFLQPRPTNQSQPTPEHTKISRIRKLVV